MVASIMAYSISGSSDTASNIRSKTPATHQSRNRRKAVLQLPNSVGRSRQGLPVRAFQRTASKNKRLSAPLRPGSVRLPKQWGSILDHWASVKTKRSKANLLKRKLESPFETFVNPESPQTLERFATEYGQRSAESALKNKDLQQVRDSKGTRNAVVSLMKLEMGPGASPGRQLNDE